MDLLNFCLTSTYFQYNGKHYKQLHSTAMGPPVSVVVAEIVMQNIEESALPTCRQTIPLRLLLGSLETLRSRFGHLTANAKPRFAVSGFTLAVCPYLGLKIRV